jgi:uncharacterized sporulation protein YeaH/YhbH (DUF444 family)
MCKITAGFTNDELSKRTGVNNRGVLLMLCEARNAGIVELVHCAQYTRWTSPENAHVLRKAIEDKKRATIQARWKRSKEAQAARKIATFDGKPIQRIVPANSVKIKIPRLTSVWDLSK